MRGRLWKRVAPCPRGMPHSFVFFNPPKVSSPFCGPPFCVRQVRSCRYGGRSRSSAVDVWPTLPFSNMSLRRFLTLLFSSSSPSKRVCREAFDGEDPLEGRGGCESLWFPEGWALDPVCSVTPRTGKVGQARLPLTRYVWTLIVLLSMTSHGIHPNH